MVCRLFLCISQRGFTLRCNTQSSLHNVFVLEFFSRETLGKNIISPSVCTTGLSKEASRQYLMAVCRMGPCKPRCRVTCIVDMAR